MVNPGLPCVDGKEIFVRSLRVDMFLVSRRRTRTASAMIVGVAAGLILCSAGMTAPAGTTTQPDHVFVDRMILFSGEADLWPEGTLYTIGYDGGGASDIRNGATTVTITTTDKGGGGGWRFTPMQFPILDRFVSDPCSQVTWLCRWPEGKDPGAVRVAFKSDKSVVGSSTASFKPDATLPFVKTFESVDEGKWRRFSVPLSQLEGGGAALTAEAILFFTEKPTELTISKVEITMSRNVSLELYCDAFQAWKNLVVRGRTEKTLDKVDAVIRTKDGKESTKTVAAKDGAFECAWGNPALSEGKTNLVYAVVRGGKDPADRSIPVVVDGTQGDNEHLWLGVKGKHVMTSPLAKGGEQIFIPVGLGYCRDVIIWRNDDGVMKYCKDHHLNTVRLPFYVRRWNSGEVSTGIDPNIVLDKHIAEHIDPVVQAAKRHGLYVILDMHEYLEAMDFTTLEKNARSMTKVDGPLPLETIIKGCWLDGWVKIAERYKDEPYVAAYELYNEMNDLPPKVVRDYYTRCLKAIREVDQRHIIILGSWDWTHARSLEETWGSAASTVDAPYNNVMFSTHEYPPDNYPWLIQEWMTRFRDKHNVPVICTEFGVSYWSNSETVTRQGQAGILAMFAKEDIGWMIWAIRDLTDDPRNHNGVYPRDSLAYTDIWPPIARIMGSPMPERK